jgi:hypothetical protein
MTEVPIVFVNSLAVRGFLNGVINLAFNSAKFLPEVVDGETKVTSQDVITANLRMDLYCAQQVYEALGKIIQEQTKPAASKDIN